MTPAHKRLLALYACLAAAVAGLISFVRLHPISSFDIYVTQESQELGMRHLTAVMRGISFFGDPIVASLSIILASALFFAARCRRESFFVLAAPVADLLNSLVKMLVGRPRPTWENAELLTDAGQSSFPSGHVVHYVVFFGFLLAVMSANKKIPSFWRIVIGVLSAFLILSISISRIYLGAHWVTDVIGGYLFGFAYLGIVLRLYLKDPELERP
ncbi:MAG: phosphatase PAP2 family protein [Elusimicrobia bacterium]|nr:phosphatase PAP2 family protein [Elusimicrobiota bacterium]